MHARYRYIKENYFPNYNGLSSGPDRSFTQKFFVKVAKTLTRALVSPCTDQITCPLQNIYFATDKSLDKRHSDYEKKKLKKFSGD